MITTLYGSTLHGMDASLTTVEVSVTKGIGYQITGLADESIRESLSRIAIALQSAGYLMPRTKLLIHLGPAGLRKSGSALDLPIALGILLATGQLTDLGKLRDYLIAGELGLDGTIRPVSGALCRSELSVRKKYKGIVLPQENAQEAALIAEANVYGLRHLQDAIAFIRSDGHIEPVRHSPGPAPTEVFANDFGAVIGQPQLKRALEIAAAGGHNLLISGYPGTGKSMLAKCLPSILPPMTESEMIETTKIHSFAGHRPLHRLITERPYREAHHTISIAGLIGGGLPPSPGEITYAHNGVLFIDEFTECKASVLEALRQPLEERKVTIARAGCVIEYPASCMLVAAMNPCGCGYNDHPQRTCTCSKRSLWWHRRKLSGPILDRFDLSAMTERTDSAALFKQHAGSESSAVIRARVIRARTRQTLRLNTHEGVHGNAQLSHELIERYCPLEEHAKRFLQRSWDRLGLSLRALDKVRKVARTIADLDDADNIELPHVAEALHFRLFDTGSPTPNRSSRPKNTRMPQLNGQSYAATHLP